jgi:hypothetical protein
MVVLNGVRFFLIYWAFDSVCAHLWLLSFHDPLFPNQRIESSHSLFYSFTVDSAYYFE